MVSNATPNPNRTQVLVVGAGPVGLMAALTLRRHGIDVRVVDQQAEERAHTFPVVLHPQSLRLLKNAGLDATLLWRGRPVTRLAVYTEHERRAVLDLPTPGGIDAGALTLPQGVLRQALTTELAASGVAVEWNTRLEVLQQDADAAWGRLVHEDPTRRLQNGRGDVDAFQADFVIGADGYDSTVRDAVGLRLVEHGGLQSFVFFDAPTQRAGSEAQLAISEDFCNAIYPLQGGESRFSFQIGRSLDKAPDVRTLQELLETRMPWYAEAISSLTWAGIAEFRRSLVESFGVGRVWLAGEAAHLTGPLGVQSLNVGLDEACELSLRIVDALRNRYRPSFGEPYNAKRTRQWQDLLGIHERIVISSRSPNWVRRYASRLMACLPASGADLDDLLAQLRLTRISAPPDEP